MHVHTRGLGLLLLVTHLVGCQRDHTLEWPGVRASGFTLFGGDPSYHRIGWGGQLGEVPPAFSVRLPGGQIFKPDELTIAKLESLGAKKSFYVHPYDDKKWDRTKLLIESGAGTLRASFDMQNRVQNISISASTGEGIVFVGDRGGRRLIPLPASRDELVELFGEPERESMTQYEQTLHFG